VGLPHVLGPSSENGIQSWEVTLAEGLRECGYRTKAVGKWHLGHLQEEYLPTANGFDSYFGLLYSNDMMPPWVQTDVPLRLWRDNQAVEYPVQQDTLTTRYTEEAIEFLKRPVDAPFFLYLAYSMPHVPLHTADPFRGISKAGLYGDVIETIDWSVGQIRVALQESGHDKDTIVVFTSDNGPWLNMPDRMFGEGIVKPWHAGSPGLLRGAKGTTYEGGMRVPAILWWPAVIPAGHVSSQVASTMDLYPTLLGLAGFELPVDRPIDGRDIMPLLQGSDSFGTREFYYYRGSYLEAVREGKWKLRYREPAQREAGSEQLSEAELFDLDVDPAERYNLAEEHPEIVLRLKQKMVAASEELGAETIF
jgi:arylsulfatase A-like enzyme